MRWSDEYNKKGMLIEGNGEEGALALVDVCAGARWKAEGGWLPVGRHVFVLF